MRDPVSGNEVPLGATPEEVRDDIPANLSENEFVIPANVVRYFGVAHFESLIKKANKGLEEMAAEGRLDPPSSSASSEELTEEEQALLSETLQLNEGGLVNSFDPSKYSYGTPPQVPGQADNSGVQLKSFINSDLSQVSVLYINGEPVNEIPEGYVEDTPEARERLKEEANSQNEGTYTEPDGPDDGQLSEDDPTSYADMSNDDIVAEAEQTGKFAGAASGALAGLVGMAVAGPLGGLAANKGGLGKGLNVGIDGLLAAHEELMERGDTEAARKVEEIIAGNSRYKTAEEARKNGKLNKRANEIRERRSGKSGKGIGVQGGTGTGSVTGGAGADDLSFTAQLEADLAEEQTDDLSEAQAAVDAYTEAAETTGKSVADIAAENDPDRAERYGNDDDESTEATGGQGDIGLGSGPMGLNKGGLVQKRKTTGKTNKPSKKNKGLATRV